MGGGKVNRKFSAVIGFALDVDFTTMFFDDAQGEAESEPHSVANIPRGEEGVEYLSLYLGWDADTVVLHLDENAFTRARLRGDFNRGIVPVLSGPQCVLDEVFSRTL